MVDRILDFIKNKYFIGAVVAIFLGLLINSIASYAQGKANEEEFKKFQEINNSLSSENPINLEDVDFEFDSIGFEIITKSVFAKKALDEENLSEAIMLFEDVFNKVKESSISKDTKEVLLEQYYENLIRLSMELDWNTTVVRIPQSKKELFLQLSFDECELAFRSTTKKFFPLYIVQLNLF